MINKRVNRGEIKNYHRFIIYKFFSRIDCRMCKQPICDSESEPKVKGWIVDKNSVEMW